MPRSNKTNYHLMLMLTGLLMMQAMGWTLPSDSLRYYSKVDPVKGRAGVASRAEYIRMHNERVMYRLTHIALTGEPVTSGPDKETEGIRRPWAPYKEPPTPEQLGYAPLGLEPSGNWDDMGWFNLYINDVGLEYALPKVETLRHETRTGVVFTWKNSQARVTQTFLLREHDDKLLMRLSVTPLPGVTIDRLALRLRNVPRLGNTAYSNPATRSNALATAAGEAVPATRVDIDPATSCWATYYNKELGVSPSGLLFLPGEVTAGHHLVGANDIQTILFLDPKRAQYHFALWEIPKLDNGAFTSYLRDRAAQLQAGLQGLAKEDWALPVTAMTEEAPVLHLTDARFRPSDEEGKRGYILSGHDAFEYADANSLPASPLAGVSLLACPGQAEPASFLIYALRDLGRVTISASDLNGPDNMAIPAASCDVRVVKVWPQRLDLWGGPAGGFAMTPELLVRNAIMPLDDIWLTEGSGEAGIISGPAVTNIPADMSRQCWLTVTVPENIAPGTYRGTITITPEKAPAGELPLTLEVLPFRLDAADEKYILGIYYRGMPFADPKPDNPVTAEYIPKARFIQDMQALRNLGFNAVTSFVPRGVELPQYLDTVFPALKQLGFRSPVIVSGWGYAYNQKFDEATNAKHRTLIETYLRHCRDNGYLRPAFYGIDEPRANRYNGIETTRKRSDITRGVGYKDWRGEFAVAGNTLSEFYDYLDYAIVSSYFTNRQDMKKQCEEYLTRGTTPLYYWQIWGEYPKGTRLNAGYFLYASGYRGVFPYVYQHIEQTPYQEYDGFKPLVLMYPSADGPVATLQSEAVRAGFIDLRYLVTLERLLGEVEARFGKEQTAEMRREVDGLLAKYGYEESRHWGRMIYGALNWPEHQTTVPNRQFDADRQILIRLIMACQDRLR